MTQYAITPRIVSFYELRRVLLPYLIAQPWAESALMDLWRMGAPDPSPYSLPCPSGRCAQGVVSGQSCGKFGCAMEKRVLLPQQFAAWWHDVSQRAGVAMSAEEVLRGGR